MKVSFRGSETLKIVIPFENHQEPHAQRSWQVQPSPPAQSEDLPPEVWLPSLSDDERLLHAARSRVLLDES